ncbi:TatD family hydrolase [Candidatus Uhrbacteria bacterium]|nr:TatD family hydrolase [Candidatus Uhrbacteria bacterium]
MKVIDTHSHLHFPDYDQDRESCLLRMQEKGIGTIVTGTTLSTSHSAITFAENHEQVWASVGYHPEHFSSSFVYKGEEDKGEYSIDSLRNLAKSSNKVIAIGETGLDFFRIDEGMQVNQAKQRQEQGFREQLRLASELDLTLIIHCRDAFLDIVRVLREEKQKKHETRTVIHCFTGNWEQAKLLLDLGCFLSFSGIITFPLKKTQDPELAVQRVIERMPMDRMLVETDAPFLAPVPHRGQKNEPSYVTYVVQEIAKIRNVSEQEIIENIRKNTKQAFRI